MKLGTIALILSVPFVLSAAAAEEKPRQHGAHAHGHGTFNIVIDSSRVLAELRAPAADIVGFEHAPSTAKQKEAITLAKSLLAEAGKVMGLPAAANCSLREAEVEHEIDEAKAAKTSSHGDKKHKHDHKQDAKGVGETHSEFHVTYAYDCSNFDQLIEVRFPYFKTFTGAEALDVTIAGPSGQKQFEVTPKVATVSLGGLM